MAFKAYFGMEITKLGNSKSLVISQVFGTSKPLLYGLFAGVGRPLALLSDSIELRTALLVIQALTLSAVDWMESMYELMTHPSLSVPLLEHLSPEDILSRVAHDGRFSGIMRGFGPSFQALPCIFANANAKLALVEYVRMLDVSNLPLVLQQLSALSALLLCATHKPDQPAFDFYLGHLPTCIHSTMIILNNL